MQNAQPINFARMSPGAVLAPRAPASARWGFDAWQDIAERQTAPNSLGLHLLQIDTARLVAGQRVNFTYRYSAGDAWIGADYQIQVTSG
jgi:hypothetical protein